MDQLNYILDGCIRDFEINRMDEFAFQEKCCSIILSHPVNSYVPRYKKIYTFDQSFKLAYDFLSSISKELAKLLIKRRNEGAFIVDYSKNLIYSSSISDIINGKPMLYIIFNNDISCSYSITHEFIHDTTILGAEESVTRNIFCQVLSLHAELLQDKYLEKIGHIDFCVRPRDRVNIIQNRSLCMNFELRLIEKFLENGYIKNSHFESIFKSFNYDNNILRHYIYILNQNQLFWSHDQRHIWGYLLATYMMERQEQNATDHREFLELNQMLNKFNENQFLYYIDLERVNDYNIFDLTKESYQKIEGSYVNQLKKIR